MMGHVRKAIMKLTFVIIVIAVTFVTVSCSSQKKGTAYSVYFLRQGIHRKSGCCFSCK